MTRVWVNGCELTDDDKSIVGDLPPISEMIQVVQLYIYKMMGQAVKPIVFGTTEAKLSRELHLLEFMFKRAVNNMEYI